MGQKHDIIKPKAPKGKMLTDSKKQKSGKQLEDKNKPKGKMLNIKDKPEDIIYA